MCFLFQFVFEGVVGKFYHGDIALDDISVNDGQCPPTGTLCLNFINNMNLIARKHKLVVYDQQQQPSLQARVYNLCKETWL